jgi:hypothetical protein
MVWQFNRIRIGGYYETRSKQQRIKTTRKRITRTTGRTGRTGRTGSAESRKRKRKPTNFQDPLMMVCQVEKKGKENDLPLVPEKEPLDGSKNYLTDPILNLI